MSTFELVDCENTLLRDIEALALRQRDVALSYRLAMESSEARQIDWAKVNAAIIARWSRSGLVRVKQMAWRGRFR